MEGNVGTAKKNLLFASPIKIPNVLGIVQMCMHATGISAYVNFGFKNRNW